MDKATYDRGLQIRKSVLGNEFVDKAIASADDFNRPQELKTHVRGALTNGATREEIREVFMQVAIYCGVPAGVDAFRNAKEVFAELDKK